MSAHERQEDKPGTDLIRFESKFMKFDSLMQFRVKHILLVSSSYDSFVLEEDGQLTDLIYNEYLELNLTISPAVRRASNAAQALEILKAQNIDLVVIFKRVSDIDVVEFGREVKNISPNMPIVLLAYHARELSRMWSDDYRSVIDDIFIWTGDVKILLSIIKLVEDRMNVDHDTKHVGVRVIIIVEDSIKFYSSYLPLLYSEIMTQTRALMAEGLNLSHKLLRMRARPKILLAENYEQAMDLALKYRKYLLAIISDFRFPVGGEIDPQAGLTLLDNVRQEIPDLPVLIQSAEMENAEVAYSKDAGFLCKKSPTLHTDLRSFIMTHFGFGNFVFVNPDDGSTLAIAIDFRSMEECLTYVAEKSLVYHANRNHFSNWLRARTEFDLADRLRPKKVSEFQDTESLRQYLIDTLRSFRHEKQVGVISDFSRAQFDQQSDFVRIGGGSLGGKGRGLAFINALLHRYRISDRFENVSIEVPTSAILGTDVFDEFVERNRLMEIALSDRPDEEIAQQFMKAWFTKEIRADLDALLDIVKEPLAVRSSSVLEDSHLQTYAGVYDTHMLPNNHPDREVRRHQLELAIKAIYASTFFRHAKVYHEAADNRVEEEKMAVIIQCAVGDRHKATFYPAFSGVALSYDYYSLSNMNPEDGVVYVALGFGKTVVEGMNCLRFSPSQPQSIPQFATIKDMLDNSQRDFFAIDLNNQKVLPVPGGDSGLVRLSSLVAEEHGSLHPICSTYSAENNRVYDGTRRDGVRIITFAPILKSRTFPLTDIVKLLLQLGSEGLNCPVEIEFAVDLTADSNDPNRFYFLQLRPMIKDALLETISLDEVDEERVVGRSEQTLGNMRCDTVRDVIIVTPESFDRGKTVEIAGHVGRFNDKLVKDDAPYLLIGPGRWGTAERWLGIPVSWDQIAGARVIIEAAYGDFAPDPSFGTHFFQNLTSFQMGYFTVNPAVKNGELDMNWLLGQPVAEKSEYITHVRLDRPLEILVDGRAGRGAILK